MQSFGEVSRIFPQWADTLHARAARRPSLSEDDVRYCFFHALMRGLGLEPDAVSLEYTDKRISRLRVDSVLFTGDKPRAAFEFKYLAKPEGAQYNQPRPQKAGELLRDIEKLSILPDDLGGRYLMLAVDDEMGRYLSSPRNGLAECYGLPVGAKLVIDGAHFRSLSATFRSRFSPSFHATVHCEFSADLPVNMALRAYRVVP